MAEDNFSSNWQAKASMEALRLRATVYDSIRDFFKQRNVLEVDTPVLSVATTPDPNIHSFETRYTADVGEVSGELKYLSTSPEFHMKRLLACGSGSIYQLCHVFRQAELGSQHNPEFTMLEWYRVDYDYHSLMQEVAELSNLVLQQSLPIELMTYQKAFLQFLNIDPLSAPLAELQKRAGHFGLVDTSESINDKDYYLDYLMAHQIQPQLGKEKLTFIYDYPASQCALAKLSSKNAQVAERFELFYQGIELANGYHELVDAKELQLRFERQVKSRKRQNINVVTWDQHLVNALVHGMPPCSGVALGVDRLIQLKLGAKNIGDVLAFPFNRA